MTPPTDESGDRVWGASSQVYTVSAQPGWFWNATSTDGRIMSGHEDAEDAAWEKAREARALLTIKPNPRGQG